MDTVLVKTILIEKGWAFDVVQQIGSFSIIKFWNLNTPFYKKQPIKQNNTLNKDFEITKVEGLIATIKNIEYDLSRGFYIVPTKTIQNNSTEFENKKNLWSMGLLVLPIKLRPFATESGQFEFSNGVSIGTVFSWTVRHSWTQNYTSNFLLYTGISSYKADSSKIKVPREDYTIVTFSPAAGWMWEKNNVQLSVLVGVDFPAGSLQKKWVYRNQPWFGIGIGIGLFKINNDTKTGNEAN